MCSNPFGIVDNQLLFQCSRKKCGEQYCSSCVQAVRGSPPKRLFVCITCKNEVTPERNMLIEKHIIWKSMCKLYGIQSLLDLKEDSNRMSCDSILQNIGFRLIHLQSRLNTLQNKTAKENSINSTDEQLISDVKQLCANLRNLVGEVKKTDQGMDLRGIIVGDCLEKYKKAMKHFDRLCHVLVESMVKFQTVNNNVTSNVSHAHEQHIKELYRMNDLDKLPSEQNIKAIDGILEDIDFRRKCLSSSLESTALLLKDRIKLIENDLERAKKKLETISIVEEEFKYLRQCLQTIEGYIDAYDKLLRDDQLQDIPCSKFILLLEKMRVRTEELEIFNNFQQTGKLMRTWQNDYGKDDEFKPKVIDLFKAIEQDVKHLLDNTSCSYSLSYKVGVIGHGSVGKSALIMNLAEIKEYSSMIAVERSTFGYLQFDTLIYKGPDNGKIIPITFIDIEGATDTDESKSIGNYIELINKADCDMYIIVFDDLFNGHNDICQKHIENNLKRKCLLVRSKADLLFNQYFQQARQEKYEKTGSKDYHMKIALNKTRNHALKTFDDKRLNSKVYLTAAMCDDNLEGVSFAEFDINELKKKLNELAITDLRVGRICNLAIRAAITVVNTCFRRGYTVSQANYKWLAAGASIIPFLDELPAYFGREKIRQAFVIHDSCAATNAVCRTKNSVEQYLMERKLTVPKEYLISGEFKYLRPRKTDVQQKPNKERTSRNIPTLLSHKAVTIAGESFVVLGAVGKVAGDAARVLVPTAAATLRAVSIASIVVGAVLTPIFAAWSFYSTGQRMTEELHSI